MRLARSVPDRPGHGRPHTDRTQANSGRRLAAALVWSGLGFLAGAIFWHVLGFGSFAPAVGLNRTSGARAADASLPLAPASAVPTTVVLVDADRCTALALDRRSKLTEARPCPKDGLALRLEPDSGARGDLAVLVERQLEAAGYPAD
jgi:hypothetical protein